MDAKQRPTLAVTFVVKLDWFCNAVHLLLKTIRRTTFDRLRASGYIVNGVKNLCGVVSVAAAITNSNVQVFQDDETLLVLKSLALYPPGSHSSFAVFAFVVVHRRQ